MDFPDKKGLELWSDLLKFEAEKSFQQRLVYLVKNGFQLSSDFLQIQVKNHENNCGISQIKKDCIHGQIYLNLKLKYH